MSGNQLDECLLQSLQVNGSFDFKYSRQVIGQIPVLHPVQYEQAILGGSERILPADFDRLNIIVNLRKFRLR
ncbi:hypothetical protein D3C74_251290 [compost metagenome]